MCHGQGERVRRGVVALSLMVAGATGCSAGGGPPEQVARPTRATEVVDFPVDSWRRLPLSPPVRVETPGIGVSSPLVRLGLNPDRTMRVPGDHRVAGWFTGAPQPGQLGPAVIAGHVDSRTGPAVFYRLRDLRPGDHIRVVRADRRVVRFRVDSLASYPKQSLPGEEVFGATTAPVLRLITCAGTFDRAQRGYRENLVVSATRVADGGTEAGR